jgi:hypothetical protein
LNYVFKKKEIFQSIGDMAAELGITEYSIKSAIAKFTTIGTVGVAVVAVYFAQQTGTSGGEIRHTEIRANATTPSEGAINKENDLNADDH